jgi:hypothetical protein
LVGCREFSSGSGRPASLLEGVGCVEVDLADKVFALTFVLGLEQAGGEGTVVSRLGIDVDATAAQRLSAAKRRNFIVV